MAATPNIPQEVIEQILSWLSAKPLLRFKSVSTTWKSLISDSSFLRLQWERATPQTNHILTYTPSGFSLILGCDETSSPLGNGNGNGNGNGACLLDFPPKPKGRDSGVVRIVGSCNGLVALSTTTLHVKDIYVWNPLTGKYNQLPNLRAASTPPSKDEIELLNGFGYDSTTDDYKVFVGRTRHGLFGMEATSSFFSVRNNSWRSEVPSSAAFKRPWNSWYINISGCFVGGALHWLPGEWKFDQYIVALDLSKERFCSLQLPDVGDAEVSSHCRNIGVLDGRLCLAFYKHFGFGCSEIWVMKEYGVKESWTKLLSLGESITSRDMLLCMSKGGQLIAINEEKQLIRYGAEETEKFNICKCHPPPGPVHPCQAVMCAETLYFPEFPQGKTVIRKRKKY